VQKVNIEKSSVTQPWFSKLLGFTFYHKKGEKGISIHRKNVAAYKTEIRQITWRSKPLAKQERMIQIRQLNHGWENYLKLSAAKSVFERLDEWVRSRIRLFYWKQW
jgi:hypothetical protein